MTITYLVRAQSYKAPAMGACKSTANKADERQYDINSTADAAKDDVAYEQVRPPRAYPTRTN